MRRLSLTTILLLITTIVATGCRQTAGPTGTAATTSTLTPLSAGQSPSLGPFGGSTRVTPPSNGSFAAPNNYLGSPGPAPIDPGVGGISPLGANNLPPTRGPVGSGVQVAGWNDATQPAAPPAPAVAPTYGTQSSTGVDPRGGGMQVIDLTASPMPPGYRPPAGYAAPPQAPAPMPQSNWQQSGPTQGNLRPIQTPPAGQVAGGGLAPLAPAPQTYPPQPVLADPAPRTATAPPSTAPVAPSGSQQDLLWRQPDRY